MKLRRIETNLSLRLVAEGGTGLRHNVYFADRVAFADANELIARYGDYAIDEASQRASRSRDLGNVIHFCRWREIARMIDMLAGKDVDGLIH